ncbi:4'-phosphopantetheinyl transferase family protein [Pseudoalteromonas luteoviolacea]|uniref:Enterobactin synthase component D n=1 Tax=Pseudoalteromonas luteoviolacea S4054 TaxID=1129367 RepID=A0A0F6AGD0_9GAMM|nr:4'-phosphopantetheinyl transferase superfamily protein [Pseudoalteromonas luteoviolacea]AOT09919.1 phosphopantetheinyl transferase [Pseudoalteromonas luteoviolacea]AOT14830.1 phosphopantetheinyl transferase [Pseudoalteromonas luteoviolacea]AOT19746.1 phosphopantetheinyl transferase [Pseudoalteromonas luteoviolacea]KKE85228.1 hypothetical protein N479_05705 [Pseudoalteromonas luteoviolacea S4054]KZN63998.1 hypothetical protein N481_02950 [Pseudoalteromonas luteoviolacea S4047-1]
MHIVPVSPFKPQLPYVSRCMKFSPDIYQDADYAYFNQPLPDKLHRAVAKRKAEYLAGRVCAANALEQIGHTHFIVQSADDRSPIWPVGVCGSITHSKGFAMAVATDQPNVLGIGIDIEHMMTDKQESELRGQILIDDEASAFAALGQDHQKPLTLVFSAKESIYKALYSVVQSFFGFEAAKLIAHDTYRLQFVLTTDLHSSLPTGTKITVYHQSTNDMVLTECVNLNTD